MKPVRWEKGAERTLATTRILELRGVRFRHPGRATEDEFTVVAAPDWVNVIAITLDGRLVLVRQFRFGTNEFSLEIPGGVMDPGEDPVAAGVRELREETGYAGSGARLLASVDTNPAFLSNRCHHVLVEGAELRGGTDWDQHEEIEVTTAPVDEVLAWARSGRISHSLVLSALFHFEPVWVGKKV